jgi:hypothetical protein
MNLDMQERTMAMERLVGARAQLDALALSRENPCC